MAIFLSHQEMGAYTFSYRRGLNQVGELVGIVFRLVLSYSGR
jgi:hypothetical protein